MDKYLPPSAAAATPTLLSLRQVAERTHASESFWRRQIKARNIRVYRIGDLVRIAEADLAEWLAAHAQPRQVGR